MKSRRILLALTSCILLQSSALALPARWTMDLSGAANRVEFHATGSPGFLRIHGKGAVASGRLAALDGSVGGTVKVGLAAFTTGIALRDRHMKEKYLEVSRYPEAVLILRGLSVPKELAPGGGARSIPFSGTLTLHGVSKVVSGEARVKNPQPDLLETDAEFEIDIEDFGIPSPGFSGVTMARRVRVRVSLSARVNPDESEPVRP